MRRFALLVLLSALLAGCAAPLGASSSNFAGPNLAVTDLLFSKTDWTISDITSSLFVGGDGTTSSNDSLVPVFDFRPYRSLVLYSYVAGLTGGTTPTASVSMVYVDSSTNTTSGSWSGFAAGNSISSGGAFTMFGEGGATPVSNTGTGGINSNPVTYTYMPTFGKLKLGSSGSPTGLTAPGLRIFLYGKR